KENLVENSRIMGRELLKGLKGMKSKLNHVGDVRAMGLLGALELVKDPETNERFYPEQEVASKVIEALYQRGVIFRAVTYENIDIICFCPPLVINKEQLVDLMNKVYEAIQEVEQKLNS